MMRRFTLPFVVALLLIGCDQQRDRSAPLRSPQLLELRYSTPDATAETTALPLMDGVGTIDVFPQQIFTGNNVDRVRLVFSPDRGKGRATLIFDLDEDGKKALQSAKDTGEQVLLAIVYDGSIISSTAMPENVTTQLVLETDAKHAAIVFTRLTAR